MRSLNYATFRYPTITYGPIQTRDKHLIKNKCLAPVKTHSCFIFQTSFVFSYLIKRKQ